MLHQPSSKTMRACVIMILGLVLLLPACSLGGGSPVTDPTSTTGLAAEEKPTSDLTAGSGPIISLDTTDIAMGFSVDIVPAGAKDGPRWALLPEYSVATLDSYPINGHRMQPQVFVFPVDGLAAANPEAGEVVDLLSALIQAPQEVANLPFLPLLNEKQVFQFHLQYLDFKNGHGLRYLTMFSQGIVPVSNAGLIYTFQGLTSDGKYYVSAILPVTHPSLPADETITGAEPPEFSSDYRIYLDNIAAALNPQAGTSFVPDLTILDAMLSSIEITD